MKIRIKISLILFMIVASYSTVTAQLSPGDLAESHSKLEGISNCTQCHVLGNKVSVEKCLACHTEIQARITANTGYHSSTEVKGKECFACHSDHHGKNFQMVRMDVTKFNHNLTGYSLSVPHAKKDCKDCHNTKFITEQKIKDKKSTWLGVGTTCLTCHIDYHRKTLADDCLTCHNPDAFKPASKFNHSGTRFQLIGKHKTVECIKCHRVEQIEGKKFQVFKGVEFDGCVTCHKDPHQNKFGQLCNQCHNEESFKSVKVSKNFDHNKTDFKLEYKHLTVSCQACHKTRFTDPVKHNRCTDCHTDYHKGEFANNGISPDCSKCHDVKGFNLFSYSIEQHNLAKFPIEGAHEATPCTDCHKKQKEWSFRKIGIVCVDCHKDIHQNIISAKYYPEANCKICHNSSQWTNITFDHSKTGYHLTGAHLQQTCRQCHFSTDQSGKTRQKFSGMDQNCSGCHTDKHFKQFDKNGITTCTDCHDTENWKASKFDHNKTEFKLDGKHINVQCNKCHKPQQEGSSFYVKYKIKEFQCESCHS
jgi:hypothetical protein